MEFEYLGYGYPLFFVIDLRGNLFLRGEGTKNTLSMGALSMNLHSYSNDRQRNMKRGLLEMVTTTVWIKERDPRKS